LAPVLIFCQTATGSTGILDPYHHDIIMSIDLQKKVNERWKWTTNFLPVTEKHASNQQKLCFPLTFPSAMRLDTL